MTKAAALYNFFSQFLTAYEENSVYSDGEPPEFPYLTYPIITDAFSDNDSAMSISLWYRSDSWVQANAKTDEISKAIGRSGVILNCDGGRIWIKRGSPFAQSMGDGGDDKVKRKYISLLIEYFTND